MWIEDRWPPSSSSSSSLLLLFSTSSMLGTRTVRVPPGTGTYVRMVVSTTDQHSCLCTWYVVVSENNAQQ